MKECKWVAGEFEELCVNPDCWNCNYFCLYEDCEKCEYFEVNDD